MRQTLLPRNVTRSTKLQGAQCAPELSFRSTEFRSPENLIFPACIAMKDRLVLNINRHFEAFKHILTLFTLHKIINNKQSIYKMFQWLLFPAM